MSKKTLVKTLVLLIVVVAGVIASRWLFSPSSADDSANVMLNEPKRNLVTVGADWCVEHRVPESECSQCNPALIDSYKAKNDWCVEHGLPESHCRLCHPGLAFPQEPIQKENETPVYVSPSIFLRDNKRECATNNAIIQFASATTAQRSGIEVEPVIEEARAYSFEAPGELIFDETKAITVTTALPATVISWLAEPGSPVYIGAPIAQLEAPEMATLQADYLESLAETVPLRQRLARADSLIKRRLISQAEYEEIEGATNSALNHLNGSLGKLRASGLSTDEIETLAKTRAVSSRWTLRSPIGGTLLERKAQLGVRLEAGAALAKAGDPTKLWIEAHVPEREAANVVVGQRVDFSADGKEFERVAGRIFWIAQFVDPQTRTITVRAELAETEHSALANRFGAVLFAVSSDAGALSVSKDAVQWEGCCNVVFVEESPGKYRPRKVTLKKGDRGHYQATSGMRSGEMVVVKGSFLLKTELMKTSLGAGCCAVEAK